VPDALTVPQALQADCAWTGNPEVASAPKESISQRREQARSWCDEARKAWVELGVCFGLDFGLKTDGTCHPFLVTA
jgi:hypothetical protein